MFTWHVESLEFRLANDLISIIEFLGLRQVRNVAGVDHEGGLLRQSTYFSDGFFQRTECVRVRRSFKPDVAVGDLQERKSAGCLCLCLGNPEQRRRSWHAAHHRPQHSGPRPDHAFQRTAAVDMVVIVFRHLFLLELPLKWLPLRRPMEVASYSQRLHNSAVHYSPAGALIPLL